VAQPHGGCTAIAALLVVDAPDCLAAPQVERLRQLYAGSIDPRTNKVVFPGPAVGAENELRMNESEILHFSRPDAESNHLIYANHSQNSLLKVCGFALQSLFYQVTQQTGIAFAALECMAVEHSVQLRQNL
jgi:hypothetical protein